MTCEEKNERTVNAITSQDPVIKVNSSPGLDDDFSSKVTFFLQNL